MEKMALKYEVDDYSIRDSEINVSYFDNNLERLMDKTIGCWNFLGWLEQKDYINKKFEKDGEWMVSFPMDGYSTDGECTNGTAPFIEFVNAYLIEEYLNAEF